jgi:hypothetical protein
MAHANAAKIQLNPTATPWTPPTETPATTHNIHNEETEEQDIGSDDDNDREHCTFVPSKRDNIFDKADNKSEDDPLSDNDSNTFNNESHSINNFVNDHIAVAQKAPQCPPHQSLVIDQQTYDCLDTSAFCTQNAHGLWQHATDSNGNHLCNHPQDTTRFKYLISTMATKDLDVYFLQDTWLEDDNFDVDVGGSYNVF